MQTDLTGEEVSKHMTAYHVIVTQGISCGPRQGPSVDGLQISTPSQDIFKHATSAIHVMRVTLHTTGENTVQRAFAANYPEPFEKKLTCEATVAVI